MADDVSIRIRLQGAQKFVTDSAKSAAALHGIGKASDDASRSARAMGGAFSSAGNLASKSMGAAASQARWLALGVGAVAVAGVKMGLSFNAQVETARLRFSLFTDDVEGLSQAVQKIDQNSAFSFGDLSDAAAMLGGSGIKDVPKTLQAIANAAAAGGKGAMGLQEISRAMSQIASKGRLSQEEVNQLTDGGAITAQADLTKGLGLTAKELQNLGGQGIEAGKALDVLTKAWTSGPMAGIAQRQTKTLAGQWDMFTGNVQKLSGAATLGMADALSHNFLPAINDATQQITEIFGREGLSNEQKLAAARKVIVTQLGPVWHEIAQDIDEADIPGKLGDAIAAATPRVLNAMADIAPKAAKAFVDGWLASGPEAQVITALVLGNKLRKSDFGKGLFSAGGGGGGKGALNTLMGTRGATPKNPLWVAVVNDMPGGSTGLPGGKGDKTPGWAKNAKTVGRIAGPLAVTVGLAELGHELFGYGSRNVETKGVGSSNSANPAGHVPAPGYGTGPVGALAVTNIVNIDSKTVSRATATTDQIEQGRLAATTAARK